MRYISTAKIHPPSSSNDFWVLHSGPSAEPAGRRLRTAKWDAATDKISSAENVRIIKKAMARFDGNVSQAAKALGLSRSALYRRLQRYGL